MTLPAGIPLFVPVSRVRPADFRANTFMGNPPRGAMHRRAAGQW